MWFYFVAACVVLGTVSFLSYLVPFVMDAFVYKEQDLKKKYNAEWALVTGASSGIGLAITDKLAKQGINVVMAALDDDTLTGAVETMQKKHGAVEFRRVGVNLGRPGYVKTIAEATDDVSVNLVFNNAGFVMTGLYADVPLDRQMINYSCNATAPAEITHHFLNRMLDAGQKGAVFFTSSPAGFMPCPMTVMYGATKAFLTNFATSIAAEVQPDGIDVLVVHPSPTNTGFYAGNEHDISAMNFFQKLTTTPMTIANCYFRSIGRTIVHDQGFFCITVRMLLKVLDVNVMAWIISRTAHTQADYHKAKRVRDVKPAAAGAAAAAAAAAAPAAAKKPAPKRSPSATRKSRKAE